MIIQKTIVLGILLAVVSATILVSPTEAQPKPNCPSSCGNLTNISYPFGVGEGCFLNELFRINCSESNPFLRKGNIIVTNISLEGQLQVFSSMSRVCYNASGSTIAKTKASLSLSKFNISNTNKFTVIGCDTYGYLRGNIGTKKYRSGCISTCSRIEDIDRSCSGTGCCQIAIPDGLNNINMEAFSFNKHKNVSDFNRCSYAFITEEDVFKFSSEYLGDIPRRTKFPVLVDWWVGNETCEKAKNNISSYACRENSVCLSDNGTLGYRCQCLNGFEGNPYLENGCRDINECERLKPCSMTCTNVPGNFSCSCPQGYEGDGLINGTGCHGQTDDQSKKLIIPLSVSLSLLIILSLIFSIYWGSNRRKLLILKKKFFEQNGGLMLQQQLAKHQSDSSVDTARIFNAEELKKATNNYEETQILGQGGYGTVYKGILPDSKKVVAIKKSKVCDQSQIEQFINEVIILTQINHRNVVKLLGCCLETEVPLLVYEFITNGTVWEHIQSKVIEEESISVLSWEMRLKIAAETADALSYLHSAASTPIIHRDVKTMNILLDENFTAKVSDFGASRLIPLDQTQLTTLVQGTLGYLDPEYFQTSQLTEKSDVYSFGVVLAELLTSKSAISFDRPENERNLAMYFVSSVKVDDYLSTIVDERIVKETNINQIKKVAKIAQRCLRVCGEDRPTMKEVAAELEGVMKGKRNHPWMEVNSLPEETESLLGSHAMNTFFNGDMIHVGASSSTTVGFDSMRDQVVSPFGNNGR